MWRLPRIGSEPEAVREEDSATVRQVVVRRVEVTVERKVCLVEVHGLPLDRGGVCPVCGQEVQPGAVLPLGLE